MSKLSSNSIHHYLVSSHADKSEVENIVGEVILKIIPMVGYRTRMVEVIALLQAVLEEWD